MLVLAMVVVLGQSPELVKLDNGMRWLLLPRAEGGRVSGTVAVRAGGVHEAEGETGAAHLLEHLAFAGTPSIGSRYGWRVEAPAMARAQELLDERARLEGRPDAEARVRTLETQLVGAEKAWREKGDETAFHRLMYEHDVAINANTSKDRTLYWGDFPRAQLKLWLTAEAQRFAAPVFREFRAELGVVLQERTDNLSDTSRALEALWELAFAGSGYAWPTVGRARDLERMSPRTLDAFYARHYAPGNAVGVLVGDFDVAEAKRLLAETFAHLAPRETPPPAPVRVAPRAVVTVTTQEPLVVVGFEAPAQRAPRAPAWEVATEMFAGPAGPLRRLAGGGVAVQFRLAVGPGVEDVHTLALVATLPLGGDPAVARKALFTQLAAWKPDATAVEAAKVAIDRARRAELRSRRALAATLSETLLFTGQWEAVLVPRHAAVTLDDVRAVLSELTPERAWVVEGSRR